MYRWRKMTAEEREEALATRSFQRRPQHSPPHHKDAGGLYLITATCYEHKPWIGASDSRMDQFSSSLLDLLASTTRTTEAWVVLPNHYHAVVLVESTSELLKQLMIFHGRTSFAWNREDDSRGRKVWFNCLERKIESDAHHLAAIHYVHHNPVKHGHVKKWDEWKWSSAAEYLERIGKEEAKRRWREYPLLNSGAGWDD